METSKFNNFVNVHWYSGSYESENLMILQTEITALIRDTLWEVPIWEEKQGVNGYQESLRCFGDDVIIAYDSDNHYAEKVHKNRFSVSFSGGFFDIWPFEKLPNFAECLKELDVIPTHFDIYLQDLDRVIEIYQLNQLYKQGHCRGFKTRRYLDSDSNGKHSGETLELGRRGSQGSGKFLRIYDKELESLGEVLGIRWELAFYGKRAVTAWNLLTMADFAPSTIAGMIFGAVDWIEKTNDSHKSRWKRLDWYQEMIDTADQITVPVIREKTNVKKKINWLHDGVSGTLAYVRAYMHFVDGIDDGFAGMVDYLADHGQKKLKRTHINQLLLDIQKARNGIDDGLPPLPSVEELEKFVEAA